MIIARGGLAWTLVVGMIFFSVSFASAETSLRYRGSETEREARRTGRITVRELSVDLDGDGQIEVAVVESYRGLLRVRVLRPEDPDAPDRFVRIAEGTPKKAERVTRFEARPLVGGAPPEVLAVFEDPSPDEVRMSVGIIGRARGGIQEMFQHTFLLPAKTKEDGEGLVSWGDASPHYLVTDLERDGGDKEVVWIQGPQLLELKGRDRPISFVFGALRTVFRFDGDVERYQLVEKDALVEFVPPRSISGAEATTQVAKIWGTAQAFWGADGDLDTSWNVPFRGASRQSLTLQWNETHEIVLIRVVPGCGGSERNWRRHHRVRAFRVVLSSGARFEVDRARLTDLSPSVEAMGELPMGTGYGAQVLIALRRPQPVSWARFEIIRIERSTEPRKTRIDEVCLSEISFH